MGTGKKSVMKKIGWTVVSLLPMAGFMVIQIGCSVAASVLISVITMMQQGGSMAADELVEMAGITETTLPSILSTVILAPISEELICRGLVFKLAGKVSPNFWVANIIQALSFGIMHGNWVQGIYAFALGIVLGLMYRRFQNIWLCMLLHAAMNFSSILVGPYYSLFPEKYILAAFVLTMLAAAAVFTLCYRKIMCKEHE